MNIFNSLTFWGAILGVFSKIGELLINGIRHKDSVTVGDTYIFEGDVVIMAADQNTVALIEGPPNAVSSIPEGQTKILVHVGRFAKMLLDTSPELVESLVARYNDPVIVGVYAVKHALSNPALANHADMIIESDRVSEAMAYVRRKLEQ